MNKVILLAISTLIVSQTSWGAWEQEVILRVTSENPAAITAALLWSPDYREFFHSKELPQSSKLVVYSIDLSRVAYRYKNDSTCSVPDPSILTYYTTQGFADFYFLSDPQKKSRLFVSKAPLSPCKPNAERSISYKEVKLSE